MRGLGVKELEIAGRMLGAHEAIKSLFGDKYEERIKPYTDALEAIQRAKQLDNHMDALLLVLKDGQDRLDGMETLVWVAAGAELALERPAA